MASILRAECTTLGFVPLLPFVQQMNPLFLLDFPRKIDVASASKIRFSAFFLGVPCARFLVCPIINNTITKILFSVAFFHCCQIFAGLSKHLPVIILGTENIVGGGWQYWRWFVVKCVVKLKNCLIGDKNWCGSRY